MDLPLDVEQSLRGIVRFHTVLLHLMIEKGVFTLEEFQAKEKLLAPQITAQIEAKMAETFEEMRRNNPTGAELAATLDKYFGYQDRKRHDTPVLGEKVEFTVNGKLLDCDATTQFSRNDIINLADMGLGIGPFKVLWSNAEVTIGGNIRPNGAKFIVRNGYKFTVEVDDEPSVEFIINGRKHLAQAGTLLPYEALVEKAGMTGTPSMTWHLKTGPNSDQGGILHRGKSVEAANGLIINVAHT